MQEVGGTAINYLRLATPSCVMDGRDVGLLDGL